MFHARFDVDCQKLGTHMLRVLGGLLNCGRIMVEGGGVPLLNVHTLSTMNDLSS
jgi:hypothetical protein